MTAKTYRMTATAEGHFWKALRESKEKWGYPRARKYHADFLAGLQRLANNHDTLHSPHRDDMAKGTTFCLHLIEHRYVAFQKHDKNTIIVAGIFHESMDIPTSLRELESMTQREIAALKREISRIQTGKN